MKKDKITTADIRQKKQKKEPITVLTAYDYPTGVWLDEAGVDVALVGDSLGNVVLGYESTIPVTLEDMVYHSRAVSRGVSRALLVTDMPFLSYKISVEKTLENAGKILQVGRAQAVKIEGGTEIVKMVEKLVQAGIPVMGHIGLTPQSIYQLGGYQVRGKGLEDAKELLNDARVLQEAGVFSIVLECVPQELAKIITADLLIPTIGIGAGPHCDGQVLVTHDLLGLNAGFKPRFVKRYAELHKDVAKALQQFKAEVQNGQFPSDEYSFSMPEQALQHLQGLRQKT